MFNKNSVDRNHVLTFLNYRERGGVSLTCTCGTDSITLDDFEISDGRMYNDQYTVNIQPITGKFIPFQLTEVYYNDVVLHIVSIERNSKINKIIK